MGKSGINVEMCVDLWLYGESVCSWLECVVMSKGSYFYCFELWNSKGIINCVIQLYWSHDLAIFFSFNFKDI